jgi:hypothetical protein
MLKLGKYLDLKNVHIRKLFKLEKCSNLNIVET